MGLRVPLHTLYFAGPARNIILADVVAGWWALGTLWALLHGGSGTGTGTGTTRWLHGGLTLWLRLLTGRRRRRRRSAGLPSRTGLLKILRGHQEVCRIRLEILLGQPDLQDFQIGISVGIFGRYSHEPFGHFGHEVGGVAAS